MNDFLREYLGLTGTKFECDASATTVLEVRCNAHPRNNLRFINPNFPRTPIYYVTSTDGELSKMR